MSLGVGLERGDDLPRDADLWLLPGLVVGFAFFLGVVTFGIFEMTAKTRLLLSVLHGQ